MTKVPLITEKINRPENSSGLFGQMQMRTQKNTNPQNTKRKKLKGASVFYTLII